MFEKKVSELTADQAAAELEHIAREMAKSDIALLPAGQSLSD